MTATELNKSSPPSRSTIALTTSTPADVLTAAALTADALPAALTAVPARMRRPRNWDWEGQYIRRRRNRFQARPYKDGRRHYLGSFETYHDARRAVVKFFEGKVKPLPRFVRPVFADGRPCKFAADAEGFVGEIRTGHLRFRTAVLATREAAHAAVVAHLAAAVSAVRDLADPTHGDRGRKLRPARPAVGSLADLAAVVA